MPSLNLLKLPIVVSLHGKPSPSSLWLRRPITTAGNPSSSAAAPPPSSPPRFGLRSSWWRITTAKSLHNHTPAGFRFGFLGFRGRRSFNRNSVNSVNSVNCSSFSEDKGGGGGVVDSSMGSENVNEDQWIGGNGNGNDRSFSSTFTTSNKNKNNHRRQPPPLPEKKHHSDKLLTLPTILTIGRVAAVPLLVGTFYMNSWCGTTATTSIFIAAAITDWLDGYLARRMKLGSAFGAFLDPVADKLMVAATLVLLCTKPPEVALFEQMPWLLTIPSIAIIGREITMSAVREWAASQNGKLSEAVAVNNLGKWKTATQMASLTILLATRDSSFTEASSLITSGVALLYISAGLALWSLVVYMKKIWKVLLR